MVSVSFLFALCIVSFVASANSMSTKKGAIAKAIFQFPPSIMDSDSEEIDKDRDRMTMEKKMALETNEIVPGTPSIGPTSTDSAYVFDSLEMEYYQNEQAEREQAQSTPASSSTTSTKPQPVELIDQSKAPTTPLEHVLDFIYGVSQWIYSKFFG